MEVGQLLQRMKHLVTTENIKCTNENRILVRSGLEKKLSLKNRQ